MEPAEQKHTKVTIIGGGLSGIMATTKITHHFLEKHPKDQGYSLEITLVDPQSKLGGNTYNRYDVNVPMAQPVDELGFDNAGSFLKHMNRIVKDPQATDRTPEFWKKIAPQIPYDDTIDPATQKPKGFDPKGFVTHNQYGHYVRTHLRSLREWIEKKKFPVTINTSIDPTLEFPDKKVEYIKAEATDITERDGKHFVKIRKADGAEEELESDVIVLATGNVAPRYLNDINGQSLKGKPGYYNLDDDGLTKANVNEADTTALIGMANGAHFAILSAIENGYKGKFILCSADGTTPELRDTPPKKAYTRKILTIEECQRIKELRGTLPADEFWNLFKKEVVEARKGGFGRHDVVDSTVPDFNKIWRMMNEEEKSTFRRKYGTEWGHMRYRMPEIHNDVIKELHKEGRIIYKEGLVRDGANTGIRCDDEGGFWLQFKDKYGDVEEVHVAKIVNNTGPSSRLADMSPLMQNLEKQGIISQHPLGGLRVDDDLHVVNCAGNTQNVVYAIGPITSGEFYEAVTIPAIREGSERLGASIIKDHVLSNAKDFVPTYTRLDNEEGQIGYAKRDKVQRGAGAFPSY